MLRGSNPLASASLINFLSGTTSVDNIPVDYVLSRSSSHRDAVAKLKNQVNDAIKSHLTGEIGNNAEYIVSSVGKNQFQKLSYWTYVEMNNESNRDLDIFRAYNGIEWSVIALALASKTQSGWQVNVQYTVMAADPYDWELFNVATGTGGPPPLPPEFLGFTQADMAALHQQGIAREYLRFGATTQLDSFSLP